MSPFEEEATPDRLFLAMRQEFGEDMRRMAALAEKEVAEGKSNPEWEDARLIAAGLKVILEAENLPDPDGNPNIVLSASHSWAARTQGSSFRQMLGVSLLGLSRTEHVSFLPEHLLERTIALATKIVEIVDAIPDERETVIGHTVAHSKVIEKLKKIQAKTEGKMASLNGSCNARARLSNKRKAISAPWKTIWICAIKTRKKSVRKAMTRQSSCSLIC